jgi:cardiolipin-specific phospholipase
MLFWTSALQVAAKMDRLRAAEAKLLVLAREFGDRKAHDYQITTFDTPLGKSVIPLATTQNEEWILHAVKVQSTTDGPQKTPLVLLHGYMNSSAYFYRNFVGLTRYFETVYSLDMLGWGLSTRPDFSLTTTTTAGGDEISAAEAFFVESIEAWRKRNNITKMILAGHSMGGYMGVAYCEKYPQHVEKLILLSPVGVPEEDEAARQRRQAMKQNSWRVWMLSGMAETIFHNSSAGDILRSMPYSWGKNMFMNYVQKRMPSISDLSNQDAIAEYLVANNTLPGSGEHCLNKVLNEYAMAKRPTEHRIPKLRVPKVTFLYGDHDWMDPEGGLKVQQRCQESQHPSPDVTVYSIRDAGHLLMLENWQEFNAGVILGAGGSRETLPPDSPLPTLLHPSTHATSKERQSRRPSSTYDDVDTTADPVEP